MNFKGRALPLKGGDVEAVAAYLGVEVATLKAVMAVESRNKGFLPDGRPALLFERHIFHKQTAGKHSGVAPDISNRRSGGYGEGGAHQYDRLTKAMRLDRTAALESASWGLGQVMGFNHSHAGYGSPEAMVEAMKQSEGLQLLAMASFITSHGLQKHLRAKSWAAFAKGYNGSGYAKNRYDTKLATEYAKRPASEKRVPDPLPYAEVRERVSGMPTKAPDKPTQRVPTSKAPVVATGLIVALGAALAGWWSDITTWIGGLLP